MHNGRVCSEFLGSGVKMVPVGGLEPPRPKARDFESLMSTNSITLALQNSTQLYTG